ncbi:hypothetical protein [Streptomyces sp. NPDC020965]|uniref:hypothetical protein n=1 Tax=Streptomyces sp. NPDC020965 TaxID=3365105 RepID=UPI0037B7A903
MNVVRRGEALEELRRRLTDALAIKGLAKTALAARARRSRTTVQQAFQRDGPVPSAETVAALAEALDLPVGELLEIRRTAAEGSTEDDHAGAGCAGPGRPVGEWDPHDLEVHPAGPSTGFRRERALPTYIPRAHDRDLAEVVEDVLAGRSRMVVLSGSSSTGKTRACWEALHLLREQKERWQLWHPLVPLPVECLVQGLPEVRPYTVVWLNETQQYLGGTRGEEAAAALRELVRTPSRAPVLVLGTLWEERWQDLVRPVLSAEASSHDQRRALLDGVSLSVPDRFCRADLHRLRAEAVHDPQLAEALEKAREGQVAQYLGGGPALVERYVIGRPLERALLHCAMDACRLGHSRVLPRSLLEAAVPHYLLEYQREDVSPESLTQALGQLCGPVRGGQAPLRRNRSPVPGHEGAGYRLADYLEQHGHRVRGGVAPPGGLWEALLAHGDVNSLVPLSLSAEERGFLRFAVLMRTAATRAGVAGAREEVTSMLRDYGWWHDLEQWSRAGALAGDAEAMSDLIQALFHTGRADEAIEWCDIAAAHGHMDALVNLAVTLPKANRHEDALRLLQQTAPTGSDISALLIPGLLTALGRDDEALDAYREQAAGGCDHSAAGAASLLAAQQRWDDALDLLLSHYGGADDGSTRTFVDIMTLLSRRDIWIDALAGTIQSAEQTLTTAPIMAGIYRMAGRDEDAHPWTRVAAETGHSYSMAHLGNQFASEGCWEQAGSWYSRAIDAGHTASVTSLARMLQRQGRAEDALAVFQRAAQSGDEGALAPIAELMTGLDSPDAAFDWLIAHSETAHTSHRSAVLCLLQEADRTEQALEWLHTSAQADDTDVHRDMISVLRRAGREQEADQLDRYGWEPDGTVSPWTVPMPCDTPQHR